MDSHATPQDVSPTPPPRNLVLCLDGTGNLFGHEKTNVIKLFQVCQRDEQQRVYYDPGVGTMGDAGYKTTIGRALNKALGGAFGVGLMSNVAEAYIYLMDNHRPGDRIFLFGFSRGAYTARVLAGFINRCGLFDKGSENLIPYAMQLFLEKRPTDLSDEVQGAFHKLRSTFRRTYGRPFSDPEGKRTYQLRIDFLGLWDSVKSYGWLYDPPHIPGEGVNESVRTVRHAIALDEQRVFFPQMHWQRKGADQDTREVWFAGVHQDVGGGYAEADSGLSKISLDWMLGHARAAGLRVVEDEYQHIVRGAPDVDGSREPKPAPDCVAAQHVSLAGPWRAAEVLPWRRPDDTLCWRPRSAAERARRVPACAVVHRSVVLRTLQPVDSLVPKKPTGQPPIKQPYRAAQLPELSADQRQTLEGDKPVLIAGAGATPARLLLPLDTAAGRLDPWAGEILMLSLGAADHGFLLKDWHDDRDEVVHRLAQHCNQTLLATVPAQPGVPAIDTFHESARKALRVFAPPSDARHPPDFRTTVADLTRLKNASSLDDTQRLAIADACGHLIDALVTVAARRAPARAAAGG